MKNLKMFAIGLVAFAAMTMGVHAATDNVVVTVDDVDHGFASISTALADHTVAAEDKITVKINNDFTETLNGTVTITKDVTLDLGGKTVNVSGGYEIVVGDEGSLTITGAANSKILGSTNNLALVSVRGNNANLVIDKNVTLEGHSVNKPVVALATNGGVAAPVKNSTITIRGKIENKAATGVAFSVSGLINNTKNVTTVTIEDGATLISAGSLAIYQPAPVKTTIGKATIEGAGGIGVKSGNVTLNGTTVTATGNKIATPTDNGSGMNEVGAAIQIETSGISNYITPATVTINGGEYTSEEGSVIAIHGFKADTLAIDEDSVIKGGAVLTAADDEPVISTYVSEEKSATKLLSSLESFITKAEYSGDLVGAMKIGTEGKLSITEDTLKSAILKGASVTTDDEGNTVVGVGSSSNTPSTPSDEQKPNTGDTASTPDDSKNPQTGDSIMTYMGLGIASIAVVGLGAKNLKKQTSR